MLWYMLQHEWPWKQHATWKKPITKDHSLWFYAWKIPRFCRSIEVENRPVVTRGCCCCLAAQLCPTLCDPMDCSLPDSSVHVTSQARILEWVAISFSKGSSQPGNQFKSPHWQADSLPLSHQGSTIVDSNRIFKDIICNNSNIKRRQLIGKELLRILL